VTWWRVRFPIAPDLAETAAFLLATALDVAVEVQDDSTMTKAESAQRAYVVIGLETAPTAKLEARVRQTLAPLGSSLAALEIEARDDTWRDGWRAFFRPTQLSERVGVRPPWEAPMDAPVEVVIDPGLAFGTGTHATTRGVMKCLDRWLGDRAPVHLLDVGCGSAILSIAAAKLGHRATGVEIDETALASARENVARNEVGDRVRLVCGSADAVEGRFPLVVANILAKILIEIAPAVLARCGGDLILSGLLAEQRDAVLRAYEVGPWASALAELDLVEEFFEGEWLVLWLGRAP
jgi:ribosomal protein L11 methyltransferase